MLDRLRPLGLVLLLCCLNVSLAQEAPPPPPPEEAATKAEDAEALLLASRCYLDLGLDGLAQNAYQRASRQGTFGKEAVPEPELLFNLAETYVAGRRHGAAGAPGDVVPPVVVDQANQAFAIVDTLFRFHEKQLTVKQKVDATLVRSDANIMIRNFPRAIEEIRAAKKLAGDNPAALFADLKLGEVHLASEQPEEALKVFDKLAKLNRADVSPLALFWTGATYLNLNRREDAIEAYRLLWERHAENPLVREAIYNIAKTYAEQGAFLDAIRLYEAVGAINSKPREKVIPGDVLTVKVWDADYFLGTGLYKIPVTVKSTSGDSEVLQLEMNKINNSLFLGTIRTELGEPAPNDGLLQVYGTDLINVVYEERFRAARLGQDVTAETIQGQESTSVIQVVDDAELSISPSQFVESEEDAENPYSVRQKSEEEIAEERRLASLSARLERGEATIRPGNPVYVRLADGDLDRSAEPDRIDVLAYTYTLPDNRGTQRNRQRSLAQRYREPLGNGVSELAPDNPQREGEVQRAPRPRQNYPRLDQVRVTLTETAPHSGVFYGTIDTAVNGPTAIASDSAGEAVPALAIDGKNNADDAWIGFIDARPDKWLEIDLKEVRTVSRIVWDRGQGADDRYLIDYSVRFSGHHEDVTVKQEGNKQAHDVEVKLEKPVACRYIRLTAHKFDSDAPAISQIQVYGEDDQLLLPAGESPLARAQNAKLEFNVGDFMAVDYLDEENVQPGRASEVISNPMGVAYVDGSIDAIYFSVGDNKVKGSLILREANAGQEEWIYARRTKQVKPKDVLQIGISDPDLDTSPEADKVPCEVFSSSGDSAQLEATEIRPTAAIFSARLQLSPSPDAKESKSRLYVRPGDVIMLRYFDEHNRNPGNAIHRTSFIYAADDITAQLTSIGPVIPTPAYEAREEYSFPKLELGLRDPDQALPGIDRLDMQALSFTTGDRIVFSALLQDLDGNFRSTVSVNMGDRPAESTGEPRRLVPVDDYHNRRDAQGNMIYSTPLAIVGDDLVWISYEDQTAKAPAARTFVKVATPQRLDEFAKLGVDTEQLPEAATTVGVPVDLVDPALAARRRDTQSAHDFKREIARKKRQYRLLLKEYQATVARLNQQIEALQPERAEGAEAPPAAPTAEDAPLTAEEDQLALDLDDLDTDTLIRLAALKNRRDNLTPSMRRLQARLRALGKYETDDLEAEFDQAEAAARAAAEAEAGEEPETGRRRTERPPPWYTEPDWWTRVGGVIPGSTLKLTVEDPDLTTPTLELQVLAMGSDEPTFQTFTAKADPEKPGTYTLELPTSPALPGEAPDGALALAGVRTVMFTYQDQMQTEFPSRRSTYLSMVSDSDLQLTDNSFLESKKKHHLGEDIFVSVIDLDMNKTAERDHIWIQVTAKSGDTERIALRETQPHSGTFRGSVETRLGEPSINGRLDARFGDTFTVSYADSLQTQLSPLPVEHHADGFFVSGSDGEVEVFARQLKRGALRRDVLFSTALAQYELGQSSTEMGAWQRGRAHLLDARKNFERLLLQYPDDEVCAHATYYLGNIAFLLGDYPGALQKLQEVIDRWPKSEFKSKALYKLGTCHLKEGEIEKAIDSFVNLAYHHPDSPLVADGMLLLAQHFSAKQVPTVAIDIAQAFIRKFPEHPKTGDVYLRMAAWLIEEKDFRTAATVLEEAEEALPDSPNMPAFMYFHADCLFKTHGQRSDEWEKGIILLKRVKYDYGDTKWAKFAEARLVEVEVN